MRQEQKTLMDNNEPRLKAEIERSNEKSREIELAVDASLKSFVDKKIKETIGKEIEGEVIITKCMRNRRCLCWVVQSAPEPLMCPCAQYISYNEDAIARLKTLAKKYGVYGRLPSNIDNKIDFQALIILAEGRRRQRRNDK